MATIDHHALHGTEVASPPSTCGRLSHRERFNRLTIEVVAAFLRHRAGSPPEPGLPTAYFPEHVTSNLEMAGFFVVDTVVHHNRNQSIRIAPESKSDHYGVHLDTPKGRESRRNAKVWF
jgi:hypothetical protein